MRPPRPHASALLTAATTKLVTSIGLLLAVSPAVHAATYVITTLAEDDLPNGNCTLREALLAASTDSTHDLCVGDAAPDTIVLQAVGTYELDDGTISSAARQLTVRGADGHPASAYVVQLANAQRFLWVLFDSDLTLENITLVGGSGGSRGGAVLAEDSDLTLRNVTILASEAANGGAVSFVTSGDHHLEVLGSTFALNRAVANQARGGAVEVELQGSGSARILGSRFFDNRIDSTSPDFAHTGGGLWVGSFGGREVELRHLAFVGNVIDAPAFASGAGAGLRVTTTEAFELEDLLFERNDFAVSSGTNGAAALNLVVDAPAATVRRVRIVDNVGGPGKDQALIQVLGSTEAVVSDLVVANGGTSGLFLATLGGACSLVAGNLTVVGHSGPGVRLSEQSCPIRIENSIVYGNATSSGSNIQVFSGSPEISPETLVGVDPGFVDATLGDVRLGPGSVAIGAGDRSFVSVGPFDAAHGSRVRGTEIDLGALEHGAIFTDGFERGDSFAWSQAAN